MSRLVTYREFLGLGRMYRVGFWGRGEFLDQNSWFIEQYNYYEERGCGLLKLLEDYEKTGGMQSKYHGMNS